MSAPAGAGELMGDDKFPGGHLEIFLWRPFRARGCIVSLNPGVALLTRGYYLSRLRRWLGVAARNSLRSGLTDRTYLI